MRDAAARNKSSNLEPIRKFGTHDLDYIAKDPIHWIDPRVLIAGLPLRQELYTSIATVSKVFLAWRPEEEQWRSVYLGALDEQKRLADDEHRHMARNRPQALNALYGEIDSYPIHAALIESSKMVGNLSWACFLALLAWPHMSPVVLGHEVPVPSTHLIKRLGQFLRDSASGKVAPQLLDQTWSSWSSMDQVPPLLNGIDRLLWKAIDAHISAYRQTNVVKVVAADAPLSFDLTRAWPFEVHIDASKMADPANEALAPGDANALNRFVNDREAAEDDEDPLQRTFRMIYEGERAFQHLPLAWNRLSPSDVRTLKLEFPNLDPEAKIGIGLTVCLALPPEAIPILELHAKLKQAMDASADGNWHLAILNSRTVAAVHGVQIAPCSYRRTDAMEGLLPSARACVIGLPQFVSDLLLSRCDGETGHLLRFYPSIASVARKAADALREKTSARLTFGRLQETVASQLNGNTQDECLVIRTMPTSHIPVGTGIYYSSYPVIRLYREHARAVDSALGWYTPPPSDELKKLLLHAHVGSELVISKDEVKKAVDALFNRAQQKIRMGRFSPERLVEAYNSTVMYTLAILSLTTGHRSTNEPFPRPSDFSQFEVLICDKRHFDVNEQRVIPLSPVGSSQLDVLRMSIAAVAGYLDRDAPKIASQLRSLITDGDGFPSCALFSILGHEQGTFTLRPFAISDWKHLWPEWLWPANGPRHFLMQFLIGKRTSRELMSYLYGHAEPGQTAFNRQSGITPQEFNEAVKPLIAEMDAYLGLKPSDPIKAYRQTSRESPPLFLPIPLYGDASPDRNAKRPLSNAEKELVRRLLEDFPGESYRLRSYLADRLDGDRMLADRMWRLTQRCDRSQANG